MRAVQCPRRLADGWRLQHALSTAAIYTIGPALHDAAAAVQQPAHDLPAYELLCEQQSYDGAPESDNEHRQQFDGISLPWRRQSASLHEHEAKLERFGALTVG